LEQIFSIPHDICLNTSGNILLRLKVLTLNAFATKEPLGCYVSGATEPQQRPL